MKIKIFSILVSLYLIAAFAFMSTGCEETSSGPDTAVVDTLIDSNVLVFWNKVIHEWFDDNSQSAMNLLTGTVVNENDQNKDIQMRDSSGTRLNFFLRSGDMAIRDPGKETDFGYVIAYDNMSESEFDTLSKITNLGSTLEPSDFDKNSTEEYTNPKYINAGTIPHTVYSFYLKEKSPVTPIYGMIRLRSAFMQGGEFNLAVDVKLNIAGQNKFNRVDIER